MEELDKQFAEEHIVVVGPKLFRDKLPANVCERL
jgi:hypothetical protein